MDLNSAYTQWENDNSEILERLPGKNIFLMYSGGKDSSLAMEFMRRAGEGFGFVFNAHAGAFPVHRYTEQEKERLSSYWRKRDIDILWYDMEETDASLEKASNPCHVCQQVRKNMLAKILKETIDHWEKLVLVPCYSLWDIVSYSMEHILGDIYGAGEENSDAGKSRRFLETAQRFYPSIIMEDGYMVFRPLIKFNGSDILNMVKEEGIPYLSIPCEYKNFRPKRLLEYYYEKMELRFQYDQVINFAKTSLALPPIAGYTAMTKDKYLREVF
ncbi:MAG: hypothetical protein JRJ51_14645 [Deltaproteobacteria bacterium]|nr:hypothetical protein [Deltaproteobacteria bacterium]